MQQTTETNEPTFPSDEMAWEVLRIHRAMEHHGGTHEQAWTLLYEHHNRPAINTTPEEVVNRLTRIHRVPSDDHNPGVDDGWEDFHAAMDGNTDALERFQMEMNHVYCKATESAFWAEEGGVSPREANARADLLKGAMRSLWGENFVRTLSTYSPPPEY